MFTNDRFRCIVCTRKVGVDLERTKFVFTNKFSNILCIYVYFGKLQKLCQPTLFRNSNSNLVILIMLTKICEVDVTCCHFCHSVVKSEIRYTNQK